jgi:hypothetical protein
MIQQRNIKIFNNRDLHMIGEEGRQGIVISSEHTKRFIGHHITCNNGMALRSDIKHTINLDNEYIFFTKDNFLIFSNLYITNLAIDLINKTIIKISIEERERLMNNLSDIKNIVINNQFTL